MTSSSISVSSLYQKIFNELIFDYGVFENKRKTISVKIDKFDNLWLLADDKHGDPTSIRITPALRVTAKNIGNNATVHEISCHDNFLEWMINELVKGPLFPKQVLNSYQGDAAISPNANNLALNPVPPSVSLLDLCHVKECIRQSPGSITYSTSGNLNTLQWGRGKTSAWVKYERKLQNGGIVQQQIVIDRDGKVRQCKAGFFDPDTKSWPGKLETVHHDSREMEKIKQILSKIEDSIATAAAPINGGRLTLVSKDTMERCIEDTYQSLHWHQRHTTVKKEYPLLFDFLMDPKLRFSATDIEERHIYDLGWEDAFCGGSLDSRNDKRFMKALKKRYFNAFQYLMKIKQPHLEENSLRFANSEVAFLLVLAADPQLEHLDFGGMLHDCLNYIIVHQQPEDWTMPSGGHNRRRGSKDATG